MATQGALTAFTEDLRRDNLLPERDLLRRNKVGPHGRSGSFPNYMVNRAWGRRIKVASYPRVAGTKVKVLECQRCRPIFPAYFSPRTCGTFNKWATLMIPPDKLQQGSEARLGFTVVFVTPVRDTFTAFLVSVLKRSTVAAAPAQLERSRKCTKRSAGNPLKGRLLSRHPRRYVTSSR